MASTTSPEKSCRLLLAWMISRSAWMAPRSCQRAAAFGTTTSVGAASRRMLTWYLARNLILQVPCWPNINIYKLPVAGSYDAMPKDLSGPSCKDDSLIGARAQNSGLGRRSLLTYIAAAHHRKTKILMIENVCTGCIQRVTAEAATAGAKMWVRTIHADTPDSGYAGCRRQRGWSLG